MKRNQLIPLKTFSNLVITTPNPLPAGTQGSLYSVTFTAAGGQQWGSGPAYHYSWFLLHDYSSTGLVMNQSTGVLSGSPSTSGLCQFVVAVTDNLGSSVQQSYTATFAPAVGLTITTSSLPNASVGSAYSFTMSAVNGTPPYTWSITSDTPDTGGWLSISSSGVLSGTPSTAETETVVIKVQDTLANTASKTFTLLVNSTSLQITTTSPLPNATPSSPYFTGISAIAGAPPYTWSLQTGYVAPTEVQSSGLISATAATASGTLNGVTAGNSILAIITYLSSPPNFHQPSGVSDGNAYTLDSFNIGIAHQSVNVYRLSNVTAGTHTVVGTKNAGDTSATWNMVLIEVVGNISPDQTVNNSGNSTGPVSPGTTATLTNANEFAVSLALVNVADTGLTVPAPWTQVGLTSNTALAYRTTSTTSGIGVNFGTLGTANEWCTVLQTYQGSGTSYPYSINSSTGVLSWNSPVLGNYTVPVQVVDTAPTTINKTFSLTVSNATGQIKWQPGHYGNIFSQIHRYTNNTGTGYYTMPVIQPYIGTGANTGIQFSGVAGLSMTCYWGYLETSTPGNYNFGGNTSITGQLPDIDQILAQCATLGKYFWLMVNLGGPAWGNSGSSAGNYIPPYILSGAAYGAADVGSSGQSGTGIFGVAAAYGGGNVANFANDNVMTAVQNLIAALAAAYDSNPYFVGIRFLAWDAIAPYAGTSMAASGDAIFYASLQTIYLYAKSVFTHTNVCFQGGFGNLTAANLTQTLVQDGILCGSSDISGASAWTGTYMALSEVFTGNGVWASAPTGTSGTLSAGQTFDGYTGTALTGSMSCPMTFSGGTTVTATFTKGSGTVTWTPSVSAQSTSGTTVSFNPLWANQSTQTYLNYSGVMNNSWPALAKPLYQVLPGAWDIEPEDMIGGAGAPYPTIFLGADLCSALNNDLHGAYAFWWMMLNGAGNNGGISTAIWESAVVPAIQAAPLINTVYPYPGNYIGVNLTAISQYNTNFPFLNAFKVGGSNNYGYVGWRPTKSGTFDTNEGPYLQAILDSDGYPTTLTCPGIPGGQQFTQLSTIFFTGPVSSYATYAYPRGRPEGAATDFTFRFQGKCTIGFAGGDVDTTSLTSLTAGCTIVGGQVVSTNAWGTTNVVTLNVGTSVNSIYVTIVALPDSSNYFKAAEWVDSKYLSNYIAGEVFHPTFKASLSIYSRARFMDWLNMVLVDQGQEIPYTFTGTLALNAMGGNLNTNWSFPSGTYQFLFKNSQSIACGCTYNSPAVTFETPISSAITVPSDGNEAMAFYMKVANWASRPLLSNCFWGLEKGCPYEVPAILANELGIDTHICLPQATCYANPTFATSYAQLYYNGAGAILTGSNVLSFSGQTAGKTNVELSNETWNTSSRPWHTCYTFGYGLNGNSDNYTDAAQWYGGQVGAMGAQWYTVYGANFANRCVVVMSCQNGSYAGAHAMNAPDWVAVSGKSAPYIQGHVGAICYAPYMDLAYYISAGDATAIVALGSQANQLNAVFGLAYTNVYNSVTYASIPTNGWAGANIASVSSILTSSDFAGQPWNTLPFIGYEGGTEWYTNGSAAGGVAGWLTLLTAAHYDQRMSYLYFDPTHQLSSQPGYLPALVAAGMSSINLFQDIGFPSQYGEYGAIDSVMVKLSPLSSAPTKYQGIANYAGA